jgi:acyl-CoA reductase-like NAD-dependent aldehyde dehydrogenase
MDNLHNFYIGGAWVAPQSEQVFPVMNPATEEQVSEIKLVASLTHLTSCRCSIRGRQTP